MPRAAPEPYTRPKLSAFIQWRVDQFEQIQEDDNSSKYSNDKGYETLVDGVANPGVATTDTALVESLDLSIPDSHPLA